MTISSIDILKKENESLKQQLFNQNKGIEGLLAQLDATRSTMNEAINGAIAIRTNLAMLQKQYQESTNLVDSLKKEIENLRNQLIDKPIEVLPDAANS